MAFRVIEKALAGMQKHPKFGEIFRFGFTGGICFAVEFIILVLLKEKFHMQVLLASGIAFLISVLLNYLMCLKWVFSGAEESGTFTGVQFFITSLAGLGWNEMLMWVLADKMLIHYMPAKVMTTVLVMIWNYFTKRYILKKGK